MLGGGTASSLGGVVDDLLCTDGIDSPPPNLSLALGPDPLVPPDLDQLALQQRL